MDSSSNPIAISVVVVFHNAQSTLQRTLDSFACQTFSNTEYVFVDDASTDRSVEIIRDFIALNPHFKDRHKLVSVPVKRGLASGCAAGFDAASGIYLMRCDADDYLEPDALQQMWDASENGSCDAVFAHFNYVRNGKTTEIGFRNEPASLNDMPLDTLHFSLCNKLLSRKLLLNGDIVSFEGLDCWEDLGLMARFMLMKPRLKYLRRPVYNYVIAPHGASLSTSSNERLLRDHLMIACLLEKWFVERQAADEYDAFLTRLKFIAKTRFLRGCDKDVAKWKNTFPEVNRRIMGIRFVKLHWRLVFSIVAILPASISQWIADCCSRFYHSVKAAPPRRIK